MTRPDQLSAADLGAAYRDGTFSPVDVVNGLLERAERFQPQLHAFITLDRDGALRAAADAEREMSSGLFRGPLHGVPVGIKDVIDVAGLNTTCHSRILKDNRAVEDAGAVARLRTGGAIILGKLATHEFALGGPSFDLPWPPARNPWNIGHHPGGSSSGSGAGLAARLFPLALGTDTGGSIRNPASACGVVGLKPTYGLVSRRGIFPLAVSLDHVGPMARSVHDTALLLDAIAERPQSPDSITALNDGVKGLRIGFVRNFHETDMPADPEVSAALESAAHGLEKEGAILRSVTLPDLNLFSAVCRTLMMAEAWPVHAQWLKERPQDYAQSTRARLLAGAFLTAEDYLRAQRLRRTLIAAVEDALRDVDILLTASAMDPPCRIDDADALARTYPRQARTAFNVTGHPALAMAAGLSTAGLPLSVQFVGRYFEEAMVLRAAGRMSVWADGTRWLRPALPEEDGVVDLSRPYDVLVIGGGNAALCAAITARQAGASVLMLEHAPRPFRGGNSRHTRNMRTMHGAPTAVLTEAYLEDEYWDDLRRVTGGATDETLARMTIRGTSEALSFMAQHGVRFQPSLTGTLNLSRTNAFFLGGGKALVNAYFAAAEKLGVDILYDSEVLALRLEDGRVRAAEVSSQGFPATVSARAIIAASGGFQANIEWLTQYWGEAAKNFVIRGTPYAKGRILRNLLDQGVAPIGDPTQCHAVAVDARAPRFDGGIVTRLDCVPFSIVVDRDAKRFYDEGEDVWPKRYAIWGRLVAQRPGQIAYSIIDSKAERLFMPSVFPAIRANSIAELATKLELDPATLEQTVRNYNQAVRPGTFDSSRLDDCRTEGLDPPKTHWARAIDTPPFIGYPLRPGITFTYLGVKVDEQARVLMTSGDPAENLFATGEIMAGNILGKGYLAGFGMAIGTVFGRIAGREAAKHAGY